MSAVENDGKAREAQQREQERLNQKLNQEKNRTDKQDFARLVSSKQEQTAKANKEQHVRQGAQLSQKTDAQSKLLAKQGFQSTNFQQQLQKQGEASAGANRSMTQTRAKDADKMSETASNKESEGTKARINKEGDKLAAISRDDRSGGGGGGKDSGPGSKDSGGGSSLGMAHGALPQAEAAHTSAAQSAQGAKQLPQEVLQQIVERVMVGINKEGLNEFHIEFKNNILAGSSLRLTAQDGKISAHFHTNDKNISRLLKASEGQLARAFSKKGLTLEKLEVEGG